MANQPHPDKRAVTFRLHKDLLLAAKKTAGERGQTLTEVVERALRDYVKTSK